jgi:hypothetical protein
MSKKTNVNKPAGLAAARGSAALTTTDKLPDAIGTAKRDIEHGEVVEIKMTPLGWESEAIDFSLLNAKMRKPPNSMIMPQRVHDAMHAWFS